MSRPDIDAIAARAAAASPDRWEAYFTGHGDPFVVEEGCGPGRQDIGGGTREIAQLSISPPDYGRANALFIAGARQDIPDLLAYITELEDDVAYMRASVNDAHAIIRSQRDPDLSS